LLARTAMYVKKQKPNKDIAKTFTSKKSFAENASLRLYRLMKSGSNVHLAETTRMLLAQNADPNYTPPHASRRGTSILGMAAARCDPKAVRSLMEAGANPCQTFTTGNFWEHNQLLVCHDRTALHEAVSHFVRCHRRHFSFLCHESQHCRHLQTLQLLLAHNADIHATDSHGMTALHIAASNGITNAVTFLVSAGANTLQTCIRQKTPLDYLLSAFETFLQERPSALPSDNSSIIPGKNFDSVAIEKAKAFIAIAQSLLNIGNAGRSIAILQSTHPRLGKDSSAHNLDSDCLQLICDHALDPPLLKYVLLRGDWPLCRLFLQAGTDNI
jgi:hypothetical protein